MMLGMSDGSGFHLLVPGMISGFRRSLLGKRTSLCYVRCSHSSVSLNAESLPLAPLQDKIWRDHPCLVPCVSAR